jgi:hypothetical protein
MAYGGLLRRLRETALHVGRSAVTRAANRHVRGGGALGSILKRPSEQTHEPRAQTTNK